MVNYDISKLQVGQVYSYKELCELIGAEYKKGAGKTYQLEKYGETGFQRYFSLDKVGRGKYEILEIYEEPLPIEDKRSNGNNQIYTHYIELILMNYLSKKGTHSETFTIRTLWEILGMINEKYGKVSNDTLISLDECITPFEINNFYMRSDKKLRQILLSALKNLRNRRLIDWQIQTVICKYVNDEETWFVANDEELKIILNAEYDALKQMGLTQMFQVLSSFRTNEFYQIVNDNIYKKKRWKNYYKRYKVIFDAKNMKESIPDVEAGLKKALLNAKISSFLNNEAENLYFKKLKEYNQNLEFEIYRNGSVIESMHEFKYPLDYIVAQKLLSNELIYTGNYPKDILNQSDNIEEDEELDLLFSK